MRWSRFGYLTRRLDSLEKTLHCARERGRAAGKEGSAGVRRTDSLKEATGCFRLEDPVSFSHLYGNLSRYEQTHSAGRRNARKQMQKWFPPPSSLVRKGFCRLSLFTPRPKKEGCISRANGGGLGVGGGREPVALIIIFIIFCITDRLRPPLPPCVQFWKRPLKKDLDP